VREILVIRQDESGVVGPKDIAEGATEPLLVTDLNRVLKAIGERFEELIQSAKERVFTAEVSAIEVGQLEEQRPDPISQEAHHAQEAIELFAYTLDHESPLTIRPRALSCMHDTSGELRRHAKTGRGLLLPPKDHLV
jgi:hypothetical protein